MKFNEARKIIEALNKAEKQINDFATIAGVEAVNHFTQNFRKQGFDDDGSVKKWQGRKRERARDSGRAILVGAANKKQGIPLMQSLIKRRAGKLSVYVMSSVKYANVHNEGLRSGRGSGFKMPKRQFVGESRKLNRNILRILDKRIQQSFR